jgi:hypothetical protein
MKCQVGKESPDSTSLFAPAEKNREVGEMAKNLAGEAA